ncbi:hypothetical protein HanIR_Chr10g0461891 [Helianthus annuus]|nr:hypothetical protein HanIR_Chr10g0461891 [Helianthus annuus]
MASTFSNIRVRISNGASTSADTGRPPPPPSDHFHHCSFFQIFSGFSRCITCKFLRKKVNLYDEPFFILTFLLIFRRKEIQMILVHLYEHICVPLLLSLV